MDNVANGTTTMTVAQADEMITLLEDSYVDPKQIMTNGDQTAGKLKEALVWCSQMASADAMTLPEDVKVMGYDPETGEVLKADNPRNCLEYRKQYLRRLAVSSAQKMIKLIGDCELTPNTIETTNTATWNACVDLAAEAQKVVDQASAE